MPIEMTRRRGGRRVGRALACCSCILQPMGPNSARQPPPSLPAATYWRRRFIALLVGMSVLALVAWALSGALDASKAADGAAGHRPPHKTASDRPATSSSHSASDSTTSATQTPAASKSSTAAPHPSTSSTTTTPDKATTTKKARTPVCRTGAVVLSLFSSQGSYATGEDAQLEIDVVSTETQNCNFDVGAGHLILKISAGTRTVWTSAQCAEGATSLITTLHRGVPTRVAMTWNGRRSSVGCPVPGAAAGQGSYTAVATDGTLRSNAVSFRLG